MPLTVYISSTFDDLKAQRQAVAAVIERMGHKPVGMESYSASDQRPLDKCLDDVRRSDVYVGILGWRYGFRPRKPRGRPKVSITEHEYLEAKDRGIPRLMFLLSDDAPWPARLFDAVSDRPDDAASIKRFRDEVAEDRLVDSFSTSEELAGLVGPALYRQEAAFDMGRNLLQEGSATAALIPEFTTSDPLWDSRLHIIAQAIEEADDARVAVIDLGVGKTWWSTRLYVFADLAADLTEIEMFAFTGAQQTYLGVALPDLVRSRLRNAEPVLRAYHKEQVATTDDKLRDTADEVHTRFDRWVEFMDARGGEASQKTWMRSDVLRRRLGRSLIDASINVDMELGLTPDQMREILNYPLRQVPITPTDKGSPSVVVVDRDSFARVAAREYVSRQLRSGV